MFEETFARVSGEASGERAFGHVSSIAQFHRIQASPGFRKAAGYCVDAMLEKSPNAQVLDYPAENGVRFWHLPSFEEWYGRKGVLRILSPGHLAGKIADFEDVPISLIQRSLATGPEGLTTEMVYVGDGDNLNDYKRAKGKIAICDSHCPHHVYEAAVKAGVRGICIYRQRTLEPVRKGIGLHGIRQYQSFWWEEKGLFGFVLTPEDGQRIVSYLNSAEARRRPVKVWAFVQASRYAGTMEVVSSLIPGEDDREMVVVAHLCHPQPSAGDNASGAGALLETHRVLNHLIQKGDLPRPRYGIRFLLVPEMTGTFAFLARSRGIRKRLLFGLNLDMVGQDQKQTGATLCIEAPPLAASSFTPFLLEEVVRKAFKGGTNPNNTWDLPSARLALTPFSGGSDHVVFSDPKVGVPTPMLMQWPDRYYHTSGDTPDKVSPDVLQRITVSAAAYLYTCALAAEKDLVWIAALAGRGLRKLAADQLAAFGSSEACNWITPEFKARFLASTGDQALRSLKRLLPDGKALKAQIKLEEKALDQALRREAAVSASLRKLGGGNKGGRRRGVETYSSVVVKRLYPGPVDTRAILGRVSSARRVQYHRWVRREKRAGLMEVIGLYWANGRRSLREISNLVAAEIGTTNPEFLRFYFDLLDEAGIADVTG
jgi:aminopeptidase YwaD